MVDIEVIDLERACSEGLLEEIPRDILPSGDDGTSALEDFYPEALASECGVGVIFWSTIFAYNQTAFPNGGPKTIAEIFDTEAFPGPGALRRRPQVNMEWAVIADGVPIDEVYAVLSTPKGQQRAFDKLDSIRDSVVWFDSWSQAPVLLNDGGAVIVQSANGRIFDAVMQENRPFEMVFDGQVFDIDVATGTVPLAGMQDVAYGPTRRSSTPLVDPAVIPFLPSSHIDIGLKADGVFWADFGETLGEQFNEWLLR